MTVRFCAASLLGWLLLIACGDDGTTGGGSGGSGAAADAAGTDGEADALSGSCGPKGTAVVNGTLMGDGLTPVARAFHAEVSGVGHAIYVDEVDTGTCLQGSTGDHLILAFCAAPTPGTHQVVGQATWACPTSDVLALVERDLEDVDATGGSVQITNVGGACIEGGFDIQFGADELTGSFDAVACP